MKNTKYKFTGEIKMVFGIRLQRIQRISDGELGGFIEKEENLSVSGDAWVSGNAQVSGNAWVYGDAQVYEDAWVSGNAQVFGNARVFGNAWVYGDAWVSGNARVSHPTHLISVNTSPYNITITPQNIVVGCHLKSRFGEDGKFSDLPEATPEIKARYLPLLKQLKRLVPRAKAKKGNK